MAKKKKENITKTCYYCKEKKSTDQMEEIGVWICKACLKK